MQYYRGYLKNPQSLSEWFFCGRLEVEWNNHCFHSILDVESKGEQSFGPY